jgi:hypothetical protein
MRVDGTFIHADDEDIQVYHQCLLSCLACLWLEQWFSAFRFRDFASEIDWAFGINSVGW